MTSSELLRFFHAEAGEYLDTVEDLASRGGDFEAGAFVAASRALRGSATMARAPRIAEIALTMERIANAVRDGEIEWSGRLRDDLIYAIGELRVFVSRSGNWSADDDRSATELLGALRAVLPPNRLTPRTPPTAGTTPIFIALQASAIAGDLENFLDNPSNANAVTDTVTRMRSLRGIAGVADHPPLGEVADAVERALRELAPDALLRPTDVELLRAAAAVFRRASAELRSRGRFDTNAADVDRFARAAAATTPDATASEGPVVRIEELFFTDAGPHIVRRGLTPVRSAEARFREDVVTRAEHLRRLVADARLAEDAFTRERVRRDLKTHLVRLDEFARSFGAAQVASVLSDAAQRDVISPGLLDVIENVARVLTTPGIGLDEMERRLAVGERTRWTPVAVPSSPARSGAPPRTPAPSPRSGRALREMIDASLSKLSSLENVPLIEPELPDEDQVVPIESLFYRGNAALERARVLRDELRASGSADPDALQELYELLDLARAE